MSTATKQVPKAQSTELIAQTDIDHITEMDQFCKQSQLTIQEAHDSGNELKKALATARATTGLRARLNDTVSSKSEGRSL